MKPAQRRYLGLSSVLLLIFSSFAACGGLDGRKVTRGPDQDDPTAGSQATGGAGQGSGGSESQGGDTNPFGGALFDGGAPPVLDGPPEVLQVDPSDRATGVEPTASVSVLFSEAIASETLTSDSFKLLLGDEEVAGEVSLSNLVGSFEPQGRLALATRYDVAVSTDVTDTTGTALNAPFSSSFTTRDGQWEVEIPIVEDPASSWYNYSRATAAIDGLGNVLVAWAQDDPDPNNYQLVVYGRWYHPATGWQAPTLLSVEGASVDEYSIQVSGDEDGNAVVVWTQYNQSVEIVSRRYVDGSWSAMPELVNAGVSIPSLYFRPFVGVRGGHAVVWWIHQSGSYYYMYAQSGSVDQPWPASPTYLDARHSQSYEYGSPSMAMDGAGNAMLVHNLVPAGTSNGQLHFTRNIAATNDWEYPAAINGGAGVYRYDGTSVSLAEDGAAMVVWPTASTPYDLRASRYTKALGFQAPESLDLLDTWPWIGPSSLTTDGSNFYVAWMQTVGSTSNVYGARFSTDDLAWSQAQLVSDGDSGVNGLPSIVADPRGNSVVLWLQGSWTQAAQYQSIQHYAARRLSGAAAWAKPVRIGAGGSYDGYESTAVVGANGVVAFLTHYLGYEGDKPGQPFLNIFR